MNFIKLILFASVALCLLACDSKTANNSDENSTEKTSSESKTNDQFTDGDRIILLDQAEYMTRKEYTILSETREFLLSVLSRYPMQKQGAAESFDIDKLLEADLEMQSLIQNVRAERFHDRVALEKAYGVVKTLMEASMLTGTKDIPQLKIDMELYKNMHPAFQVAMLNELLRAEVYYLIHVIENAGIRVEPSLFDIINTKGNQLVAKGENVEFLLGIGTKRAHLNDKMSVRVNGQALKVDNGKAKYTTRSTAQNIKRTRVTVNIMNLLTGKVISVSEDFRYYIHRGSLIIGTEGETRLDNAHFDKETAIKKLELITAKYYALLAKLKTVLVPQMNSLAQTKKFIDLEVGTLRSEIASLEEKNFETKEQFLAALLPIEVKHKKLLNKLDNERNETGNVLFHGGFAKDIEYLGRSEENGYGQLFYSHTLNKGYKLFLANVKNELEQVATYYSIELCRLAVGRRLVYDKFAIQIYNSSPSKIMSGETYDVQFGAVAYSTQIEDKNIVCKVNGNKCKVKDGLATYSPKAQEEGTYTFLVEMELENPLTGEKEGTKTMFKTEVINVER